MSDQSTRQHQESQRLSESTQTVYDGTAASTKNGVNSEDDDNDEMGKHRAKDNGALIGAINNVAIQYNISAASVAIAVMAQGHYTEPHWAKMTLLGTVFAGAVIGMVSMGVVGDLIGRKYAMLLTLAFSFLGSVGCAAFSWGGDMSTYAVISACRLVLGIGVGGLYPLSAAKVAETNPNLRPDPTKIGWSFFFQAPGSIMPYIVAWLLSAFPEMTPALRFRIIFGLGALPIIFVIYAEMMRPGDDEIRKKKLQNKKKLSFRQQLRENPEYFKQLIGTGGTWFLYDISYYGTAIFQPTILKAIFRTDSLSYWQNIVVSMLGIPGVICAILLTKPKGLRWLNIWGFVFIACAFAVLGVLFEISPDGLNWPKFAAFCVSVFSLNMGPNVATYVLPATLFPFDVRTTFHGLSAGSGKLGAVVGTFMFAPIKEQFGIAAVIWVQVAVALLAAVISHVYIDKEAFDEETVDDDSLTLEPRKMVNPDAKDENDFTESYDDNAPLLSQS